MTRPLGIGAAIGGGVVFLAAGIRTGAGGIELARLLILGVALGAIVATDLAEHPEPDRDSRGDYQSREPITRERLLGLGRQGVSWGRTLEASASAAS